jgi:ankyrin repeat protein
MGGLRRISNGLGWAVLLACAVPAAAQFSDSYNFIKAIRDRDGDKVMTFLNKPGAPVLNTRDGSTGEGALHIIVRRHDTVYLQVMLARGADANLRDRNGNTPLIVAAQIGDPDMVRLLLAGGASVNATNNSGETALIAAVQRRDPTVTRALIAAGGNPAIADTIAGKTARDYASEDTRSTALVKILDEAKPKIDPAKMSGPILPH